MSLKIFAKNTLIYSIGTIGIRVSTFLLIPLYTHYFSVSEYGILAALFLTTQILIMVVDFGMMPAIIRFTDQYSRKNETGLLLGSTIFINILIGIVITVSSLIIIKPILELTFDLSSGTEYTLLIAGSAVFQCFSINLLSYFRAANKAKIFIFISLALTISYSLITIIFVTVLNWGLPGIFIAQILSYGLFWILLLAIIIKHNHLSVSGKIVKSLARFGFPLVFARSGDLILDASIIYFLGYFSSLDDVGIFSLATKIASILLVLFITPFQLSYEPYIYSKLDEVGLPDRISKIFTYLVLIFVTLSIVLLIAFRDFIHLIAPEDYYPAYYLIFFILPVYAFRGINTISQALIHIQKKTNITGSVILISTIIFLVLGYFLIKEFHTIAAIIVSNLFWLSITSVLLIYGQKQYPIKLENKRLIILSIIYIVFSIIIYYLSSYSSIIFYSTIITLISALYFFLLKFNFFSNDEKVVLNSAINKLLVLTKIKPI